MANAHDRKERRRHPRVEVVATAGVFSQDRCHGRYLVRDLSAGGACLVGGASMVPGAQVTLLLELPRRRPKRIRAEVVRCRQRDADTVEIGVRFTHLPAGAEDLIQAEVTRRLRAAAAAAT